ncbi:GNAT family N-acetyltransferase [Streptomyces sp. NPDC007369]|uniref:GNAT family N-acetyltransferase n=1 Tax=Streptomyces sp. NPDC007369 TaxID=3154589 RepID=UPI0034037229
MNAGTAPPPAGYGIRCARPAESHAVAALLARSFANDPVMAWMVPGLPDRSGRTGRTGREHRIALYFRLAQRQQRQQRPRGCAVRVAATAGGRLLAAALWSGPGRWKTSPLREPAAMPTYARVFRPRGMPRAADVQNALHAAHPDTPHWYLPAIGTDPEAQGAGIGSALPEQQPDHCDRLGQPAYLESSNPSNVPFYERFGFRGTAGIRLPEGGPTVRPLWRTPAPRRS